MLTWGYFLLLLHIDIELGEGGDGEGVPQGQSSEGVQDLPSPPRPRVQTFCLNYHRSRAHR